MRGFVLQDWITIRGGSLTVVTQVIQNEQSWLSLEMYQDAIFWLQVSESTTTGGTLTLNYETAPIKDESLFSVMPAGAGIAIAPVMTPPTLTRVIGASATVPLSRWVRWRLVPSGGISNPWDVTFRILLSCNQLFSPGMAFGLFVEGRGGRSRRVTSRHGRRDAEGEEAANAIVVADGVGDHEAQLA